ncbi:MAG: hypothetical protein KH261_03405 [Veillonella sp.]|nr:hypothetical protein [Veillonella sp.]
MDYAYDPFGRRLSKERQDGKTSIMMKRPGCITT